MKLSSPFRLTRGKAWLAGSAVVALSVAGFAIADPGTGTTKAVSATFVATTISDKTVQTCTGTDGNYEFTHATYSGTSTSADPNLNGALKIDVKAVYNTTTNLGWVKADVQIDGSTAPAKAHGHFTGVNVNGTVQGFLTGDEQGPGKLMANATGAFTSAGGFISGSIGTGSATNTGIVTSGSCHPPKPVKPPKVDDKGHHAPSHDAKGHK